MRPIIQLVILGVRATDTKNLGWLHKFLANYTPDGQHGVPELQGLNLLDSAGTRSVKYEFGDLTALNAGAIGAFGRAVEHEGDAPDAHLTHAVLAEERQLGAVQDRRRCVVDVLLHLDGIREEHRVRFRRSVREELSCACGQNLQAEKMFSGHKKVTRPS